MICLCVPFVMDLNGPSIFLMELVNQNTEVKNRRELVALWFSIQLQTTISWSNMF